MVVSTATPASAIPSGLNRDQLLALYRWMRLTRTLEERLVALYRQTKVVGGLFRSLGQEACAVGSAFALERTDVMAPLIRNLGSMLVKGATPVEILRQYMAKGDSPTRGRELNIHFGDVTDRHFIGQISHLGDMVPVMAGVTLTFRLRGEPRVGLVYVGDGATSTGSFHEGINFAAVPRCPLVVVVGNNGYAYSTPTASRPPPGSWSTRRSATACRECVPMATTCSRSTPPPAPRSTMRAPAAVWRHRVHRLPAGGPRRARNGGSMYRRARWKQR